MKTELVFSPDGQAYARAVRESVQAASSDRRLIPVIAPDASALLGFPEDVARAEHVELEPGLRFCVATNDPVARAAASLLAALGGRRLVIVEDDARWEEELAKIYAIDAVKSVAFVVPGWAGDRASSEWLKRTILFLRANKALAGDKPFGIITAPTPAALTQLVAKSLLEHAIARRYAAHPGYLMTTESWPKNGAPIPHYDANDPHGPLLMFDKSSFDNRDILRLTELPASLLVVSSHGRSYCAANGYLCGARALGASARSEIESCVLGMSCADPSYGRIDPRRYDAPILVLDCCGAGNWAAPVWDVGHPSVGYFALAGPASAAIVSDGMTMSPEDNTLDIFWALWTSQTLGEAAARLNSVRPFASIDYPYFLLGDPEISAGQKRWKNWVSDRSLDAAGNVELAAGGALYQRVAVPAPIDDAQSVFVVHNGAPDALAIGTQYRHAREHEMWLRAPSTPLMVNISATKSPRLPRALLDAARSAQSIVSSWSPAFEELKAHVVAVSGAVAGLGKQLERLEDKASLIYAPTVGAAVGQTMRAWSDVQLACCEHARTLAPSGLWQRAVWRSEGYQARMVDAACPLCGLAPLTERVYDSPPAPARIWSECRRCDILADRPLVAGYPSITIDAPKKIEFGKSASLTLSIQAEPSALWVGAGMVAIAGRDHGVVVQPASFRVWCDGATPVEQKIALELPEPPPIPHLYRLLVMTLLNNNWFWASRLVTVTR